jgi:signal transduction histidine kinase/phage shock protein PspC (stress-responsive transcriptional regulator)
VVVTSGDDQRGPDQDASRRKGAPSRRDALVFQRSAGNRVVAGVAAGLGDRLGIEPVLVRTALVVLSLAGGAGVALYLVGWALSHEPPDEPARPPTVPVPARREPTLRQAVALGCIVLGLLLLFREVGLWFGDALVWPVALGAAGFAVIWARGDSTDRARWAAVGSRIPGNPLEALFTGRVSLPRIAFGGLFVGSGMAVFLAANDALALAALRNVALAVVVTAAGIALIFGPWMARLARQVTDERRERIRSEERAEMAAHLHDSVLHTLALIQRADAPPEVTTLARRQERELRTWLHGRDAPAGEARLSAAVEAAASRVEQLHNVVVDVVVVGDGPMDERAWAIVHATQEAAINAARHSGAQLVSVYVEAEPDEITAFVRDQGKGFDPDAVPEDRRGIAESIRGRMRRHGGTAAITSEPGEGTEVHLHIPREAT